MLQGWLQLIAVIASMTVTRYLIGHADAMATRRYMATRQIFI